MIKVLLVDNDPVFLEAFLEFFEKDGDVEVHAVHSNEVAIAEIERTRYDVVVGEYQNPGSDRLDLLNTLRKTGEDIPFIVFTGKCGEKVVIEAMNNGANFYLKKKGSLENQSEELRNAIVQVFKKRRVDEKINGIDDELTQILQDILIPTFVIDSDHRVTYWNRALESLTGIPAERMVGTSDHWSSVYPSERPLLADLVIENADDGTIGKYYEGRFRHSTKLNRGIEAEGFFPEMKGGTWLYMTAIPLVDRNGRITGAIETAQDITRRKNAEDALRESESRYRTIFENTGSAMVMVEDNGIIKLVNSEFERISGYSKEEVEGNISVEVFFHKDEREDILNYHRSRRGSIDSKPYQFEFRLRRKDGEFRNVYLSASIIPETGDTVASIIDITEMREIERRLARTMKEEAMLLDNIDTQVWISSDPETYGKVNKARAEFLGLRKEDIEGKKLNEVLRERDAKICLESNAKAFRGETVTGAEWINTFRNELRCALVTKTPVKNEGGEVDYLVCTAKDITEFELAKQSLEQLNDVLRLVNKILRHDLLNECFIIGSAIEFYLDEGDDSFLEKGLAAVRRSSDLIHRMKEFESLISRGETIKACSFEEFVTRVLEDHSIEHTVIGDCSILADEALESALDNIVRNAIFHGEAKRIDVTIEKDDATCVIRIADDGKGIPDDVKGRVFEEGFKYGKKAGSGLGLYLAKRTVERYRGEISLHDNHPRGAVFILRFPLVK